MARQVDEMNLAPGDILLPSHMLEPGWWVGEKVLPAEDDEHDDDDDEGGVMKRRVFPSNFVQCFLERKQSM